MQRLFGMVFGGYGLGYGGFPGIDFGGYRLSLNRLRQSKRLII